MNRFSVLRAASVLVLAMAGSASVSADVPIPAALSSLQPGEWLLRSLDGSAPPKKICIGDPRVLLQLRHGNLPCRKIVITNSAAEAVVNYSCGAVGNGRTSVRVETPRVVQIESQGIADKAPFELVYEGRRTGPCPTAGPTAQR